MAVCDSVHVFPDKMKLNDIKDYKSAMLKQSSLDNNEICTFIAALHTATLIVALIRPTADVELTSVATD